MDPEGEFIIGVYLYDSNNYVVIRLFRETGNPVVSNNVGQGSGNFDAQNNTLFFVGDILYIKNASSNIATNYKTMTGVSGNHEYAISMQYGITSLPFLKTKDDRFIFSGSSANSVYVPFNKGFFTGRYIDILGRSFLKTYAVPRTADENLYGGVWVFDKNRNSARFLPNVSTLYNYDNRDKSYIKYFAEDSVTGNIYIIYGGKRISSGTNIYTSEYLDVYMIERDKVIVEYMKNGWLRVKD